MGITPNFTKADIDQRMGRFIDVVEKRIVTRLQYLGELCVRHARENGTYIDQTGNLRSSVGYMVFKDGVAIHESFDQVRDGAEGVKNGKAAAQHVASGMSGYVLVVVAGMSYAVAVESRGRDVLSSAEILATQQMPKMLEQLQKNINSTLKNEVNI